MRTVCALTLLMAMFAPVSLHGGEVRIWTDRKGRRAEAEYLGLADGKIQVRRTADSRRFEVPVEVLSDADQAFVRSQERADGFVPEVRPDGGVGPSSVPQEISVEEVLKWLKGIEPRGQGCGGTIWKGELWSYYASDYSSVVVPWSPSPVRVSVGFVYGKGQVGVHHLIEFSGPTFRFRRTDDSPTLRRIDTKM